MTLLSWITSVRPSIQISPHSEALEGKNAIHLFWRDTIEPMTAGVRIMQMILLLSGWCQCRLALREKLPHMFGLWFPHLPHSKKSLAAGFNKRALAHPLWTQSMGNQARDFSK